MRDNRRPDRRKRAACDAFIGESAMTQIDQDRARRLDDPEGFAGFYDEALPIVYRYLLARCGRQRGTAEDLTQETFVSAVAEIRRGAVVTAPIPWVLGIARHRLADHCRRADRETRKLELAYTARADSEMDDEAWAALGSLDATLTAMNALPATQRAALCFRYLDDLPVPEVAQLLGRSVHAAESLLSRARENFKRAYTEAAGV
jgi:RNA polymerase sigma-70 factor, ECF subfamily